MSTELGPTPECDAYNHQTGWTGVVPFDFARRLERERDSAKSLNRTLLDQLEAQAVQSKAVNEELAEARLHHRKLCLALLSALGVQEGARISFEPRIRGK